ncbi:MAG TPA: response regulator transcription factor [Nocardioides sp.]|nr:response regulator transcription factor [Nocardioides sp.]
MAATQAKARILVVDDERALRHLLEVYLAKEGFEVLEAADGEQALTLLGDCRVDLAVVDVMLPGMDGFEVVRRIRARSSIPIILLTARGEETNRVAGLEIGADDYVVKPFSAPEVVARVRAHLRREHEYVEQSPVLRVGAVEIDPASRRCTLQGRPVDLTRREFDLLAVMAENVGLALSRDQLLDAGWDLTYVSPKTVDVHVAGLRRKLGDAISISTLRGTGYRLEG